MTIVKKNLNTILQPHLYTICTGKCTRYRQPDGPGAPKEQTGLKSDFDHRSIYKNIIHDNMMNNVIGYKAKVL